jgi:hypothetical protein
VVYSRISPPLDETPSSKTLCCTIKDSQNQVKFIVEVCLTGTIVKVSVSTTEGALGEFCSLQVLQTICGRVDISIGNVLTHLKTGVSYDANDLKSLRENPDVETHPGRRNVLLMLLDYGLEMRGDLMKKNVAEEN